MSDRLLYLVFLAVLLLFTACDKSVPYQPDVNTESKIYLSVSIQAQAAKTRSGVISSINEQNMDFEDGVHNLAMLIFDSVTGTKIGEYFNSNIASGTPASRAFKVELTPGQRDFYFVANMPNLETDMAAISDRNEMDTYLSTVSRELNDVLYRSASDTVGFPMARVYLNQMVTEGGTIYQPKPFKPKQYDTEEKKVVVNAAGSGGVEKEYVELIRVVAKLEVILDGATDLGVDKVYFRNANRHFRLVEFETSPVAYFNDNSTNTELRNLENSNTYVYYMPEAIIPSSVMWSNSGANHQPINYFTIVTLDGTDYDIPVISVEESITSDYLAKAKGVFAGFTPDYNIYRNHHYKYVVRNLQQIEVILEIDPWEVVNESTYMGYGYNVAIDEDGNVTITNTIDDCMPHKVRLVAVNGAYFGLPGNTMVEYGYESESETGYDANKSKAGYAEHFQVNTDAVATGQPYLEVYYNKVPDAGVTPDKIFTK